MSRAEMASYARCYTAPTAVRRNAPVALLEVGELYAGRVSFGDLVRQDGLFANSRGQDSLVIVG